MARRHMGGRGCAAALAVTADDARSVLAVGAKDAARLGRMRAALAGMGRGAGPGGRAGRDRRVALLGASVATGVAPPASDWGFYSA